MRDCPSPARVVWLKGQPVLPIRPSVDSLDSLVCQSGQVSVLHGEKGLYSRSGSRYDTCPSAPYLSPVKVPRTNFSLLENVTWHDTHFTSLGNDTRAVSADHPRLVLRFQSVVHPDLIPLRNTLGDSDNEFDLILDSFDDSIGGTCWRDVDD